MWMEPRTGIQLSRNTLLVESLIGFTTTFSLRLLVCVRACVCVRAYVRACVRVFAL